MQESATERYGGTERHADPGAYVLACNYRRGTDRWAQGHVLERSAPITYRVQNDDGTECSRRIDQVLNVRL